MIKSFNNKTEKVGDDFKNCITKGSKLEVAASIFSIYGFESLKSELKKVDELKFIFTDPTFVETDKENREQRVFQINSHFRQKSISGSEFEINLKNELKGKSIARECKRWIENKVIFKTNRGNKYIQPHLTVHNDDDHSVYMGINEFSSTDFGYQLLIYFFQNAFQLKISALYWTIVIAEGKSLAQELSFKIIYQISNQRVIFLTLNYNTQFSSPSLTLNKYRRDNVG